MGKMYDISMKITNELPCIKIADDLIVTVNNRKNTVINVQAMMREMERKEKEAGTEEEGELAAIKKALDMIIGKKNADAVEALDLPLPEYQEVFNTIMQVATGQYDEKENASNT